MPPSRGSQPEASGDESSRGTLDSFIPPPQNFEGDNNPFCSLGTLHPLLRPTTRQLSEKDIKVTKNGEVRRRYRRRKDALAAYLASRLSHASTHVAAKYPDLSNMGSVRLAASSPPISRSVSHDPSLSSEIDAHMTDSVGNKSVSDSKYSIDDLKNSVSCFFGASSRIARGEKFCILAKRITMAGNLEYLIEWDTGS